MQYAPDLDPATPGVLTDVVNVIPTQKGYAGSYAGVNITYDALAAECRNIVITKKLSDTRRFFAATQTKIYEGSSGTWTAVEAGTPDVGNENRWAFAQFGDYTLATAKAVVLQASSSGAFSSLTAPSAACMATGQGFVMLGNTTDATYGDSPNRWWCSAIYDHTDWTPAVATQCTTGRLVDTPGPIVAMTGFGSTFVAFKSESIYVGSYVGSPSIFQWSLVPGQIGVRNKEAIAQAGLQLYFMGNDNFYVFDGSRPVPIGNPLREWFFKTEVSELYLYKTVAAYDRPNQIIWFFYVPNGQTTLTRALTYHIPTGKWGKSHLAIEAAATYFSDAITIDGLNALSATIDGLPDIAFDSPYWSASSQVMAYADTSHQIKSLSGNCATSSVTTGSVGDVGSYTLLSRIKPRFLMAPTSATLTHQYDNDFGDNWTTSGTSTLTNGAFDLLHSARWHRGTVDFVGPWEMIDFKATLQADGEE